MKIKTHEIKHALSKKHRDDFFLTEVKNGPTHTANELAIIDALAIRKSWVKPCITGYEIKVSRSDFINDSKWPAYKDMCHRFSFVCPKGLIKPNELPEDVGLIWFNSEKQSLYTRKKSLFRDIKMPTDMFYYIILSRLENIQHPFFSTKKEFFKQYLADKIDSRQLGDEVGSKLIRELSELQKENFKLKRQFDKFQSDVELLNRLKELMRKKGLHTGNWMIEKELKQALSSSLPPDFIDMLQTIKNTTDSLCKMAGNK